jgi:hypothetical protein
LNFIDESLRFDAMSVLPSLRAYRKIESDTQPIGSAVNKVLLTRRRDFFTVLATFDVASCLVPNKKTEAWLTTLTCSEKQT